MDRGRSPQIGIDPDALEGLVMDEGGADRRFAGARRMDLGETQADQRRKTEVDPAGQQVGLPDRMILGRQIGHGEEAGLRILGQDLGHAAGQPTPDMAQPGRLGRVAGHGRLPDGHDLQPRQGPLDAQAPAGRLDEMDVGRHAPRQRQHRGRLAGAQEPEAPKVVQHCAGVRCRAHARHRYRMNWSTKPSPKPILV